MPDNPDHRHSAIIKSDLLLNKLVHEIGNMLFENLFKISLHIGV